jgi:D-sedoheptulose 7-phosphate isomerase
MGFDNKINDYLQDLKNIQNSLDVKDINTTINMILGVYEKDKTIFILGNGGSASTASHFACDLAKGTLDGDYSLEKRLKVLSLSDNIPLITAYGNDVGYNSIFVQQLKNFMNEGDLVISITGSGNSQNVVEAVKYARKRNAKTVSFLGFDGGEVYGLSDHKILVNSNHYGKIEDVHMTLCHLISDVIREELNKPLQNK